MLSRFMLFFAFLFILFYPDFNYAKTFKVGIWHNPPLSYVEHDKVSGFVVDIFKYIAEKENIKYEIVTGNWNGLYEELVKGNIDIFLPIGYSDERLKYMKFSSPDFPLLTNWGQIVSVDKSIKSVLDLEEKRILVVNNDIFFEGLQGLKSNLKSFNIKSNIIVEEDYDQVISGLIKREGDAGLVSRLYLLQMKDVKLYKTNLIFNPVKIVFAFNRNFDGNIISKINNELKNLIENRDSYYYKRLNFLLNNYVENYNYSIFIIILIILTGISLFLFIFNKYLHNKVEVKTAELKEALQKLSESELRLNLILNSAPHVIFIFDEDGTYLEIITSNEGLLFDFKENLLGKKIDEVMDGAKAREFMSVIKKAIETNEMQILRYELDVKGGYEYFEGRVIPIELGYPKKTVAWYAIDITELKNAMDKVIEEKEKLNAILKSISEGVIGIDKSMKIIFYNDAALDILKLRGFNLLGKDFGDVIKIYKNGKKVNIPFKDIFDKGIKGKLENDCILKLHDGSPIYIGDSFAPLFDAKSKISGAVFVFNDITEKRLVESRLYQTKQFESIGKFAGGLAHDFNNYLAAIRNYANLLANYEDNYVRNIAIGIDKIVEQSVGITKQLLTFSKGGEPVKKKVDIINIIENCIEIVLSGTAIEVKTDFLEEPIICEVDPHQLAQVFTNLLLNARDAIKNKGEIVITTNKKLLDENNVFGLSSGKYVEIRVKDSGPGIPYELSDKIFEPYFSTKEKGHGLGLAVCYSIIKKHNGIIYLNQGADKGAEFVILLKSFEGSYLESFKQETVSDYKLQVLYMDDEKMLRDSFGMLIKSLGCEVRVTKSGEEVLEAIKDEKFDMIFLDLTIIGGMGGIETVKKIKEEDPGLYVVVTSGYSDNDAISNYKKYGFDDCLIKPFSLDEIKRIIDRYLRNEKKKI
ncbi:response regulator [Deferribacter autotrophicus]|uniref:histidine kinase n=1 Tax=Deferribacter autotrophicus TaxID=500465 RepID=A0A5A8F5Q1_9BACT|nr:transporter substrate-binding domain-containing protein [Deferribacter autotrophicus]KAA0259456.1 response regulator [Deferribacter autotrophicus]